MRGGGRPLLKYSLHSDGTFILFLFNISGNQKITQTTDLVAGLISLVSLFIVNNFIYKNNVFFQLYP